MLTREKISVVMPAYNEEENIFSSVREFKLNDWVDEVVVVNNNSTDNTAKLARKAGAKVVNEEKQGYGYACQRALREGSGDLIILVEPDGTFEAKDILKFLSYSDNFDLVLGTRTSKELVWEGANMGIFLKYGNWFLGKLIEFLFNGPALTDVGCTYRLIRKESLKKIQSKFSVGGSEFSPEMMILGIKNKLKVIEISVNYKPRRGISKITGKKLNAFLLGLRMIKLILSRRFTDKN